MFLPPMKMTPLLRLLLLCLCAIFVIFILRNNESKVFSSSRKNEKWGQQQQEEKEEGERKERFEIRFKNIRLKCRMEFGKPCPTKTTLIVLTMSRRDSFMKRNFIRETWMKDSVPGEVIRFLIADEPPTEAKDVQQKLDEEQKKNGDLVFLHGFDDSYAHLHLKWYGGLQWQQSFCADAEWVLKADDDSIVHLRRLAYWTENKFRQIATVHPLVYFGYVHFCPRPYRDPKSKWYAPKKMYSGDKFPPFVHGTVYLTTPVTAKAILAHTAHVDGFYLEDVVFTGLLAQLANVTLSDQKEHFLRLQHPLHPQHSVQFGACVNGVPTALSAWSTRRLLFFEYNYLQLKSIRCTTAVEVDRRRDN